MNLKFKGDISVYVLLMLGMAIGLYLMGFSSVALTSFDEFARDDGSIDVASTFRTVAGKIASAFTHIEFTAAIVGFSFLSALTGSGNYSTGTILSYLIPIMIVFVVANVLFFPVVPAIEAEAHASPQMNTITLLLSVVFNTMLFLAILEYSSGRE